MNLLIDLGNSRLKWAWCDDSVWDFGAITIDEKSAGKLMAAMGESHGAPRKVGVVSVVSPALLNDIKKNIIDLWNVEPIIIESVAKQLGVINGYKNPAQLGDDRWAGLIAARAETALPVCVISCGTATTIDAMNSSGEFIGGSIFPGLGLLRQSLHDGTAEIDTAVGENNMCQATSTAEAVSAGTFIGLAGAINKIVREHHNVLGKNCVNILTGGNSDAIASLLDFPVKLIPDLVLRGAQRILAEAS